MRAAEVARDDWAVARGRVASKADDGVSFFILCSVVVGRNLIVRTSSGEKDQFHEAKLELVREHLPSGPRLDSVPERAMLVLVDPLVEVLDFQRQREIGRIRLLQQREKWRKKAAGRLLRGLDGGGALCYALEAVPRVVQGRHFVVDRRIQALEVESTIASIAAEEKAAAATGGAGVVVVGKLVVFSQKMILW